MGNEIVLSDYLPEYTEISNFKSEYTFTVMVPVYNSENTIHRVFKSLNNQTFKDFEVIIINDGSTDNTHVNITNLLGDINFKCHYINNSVNKHKMGLIFEASKIAKGEFFIMHDADDECLPESLETFKREYDNIPEDLKPNISGVTCCCIDENGNRVGDKFPETPFYSNSFKNYTYYKLKGEKWGFIKTKILKGIKVDRDIFGRGLIPESFLWYVAAKQGFKTKYFNTMLRIYYLGTENSLSDLGYEKKAFGMALHSILYINYFSREHLHKKPIDFLKKTLCYSEIFKIFTLSP